MSNKSQVLFAFLALVIGLGFAAWFYFDRTPDHPDYHQHWREWCYSQGGKVVDSQYGDMCEVNGEPYAYWDGPGCFLDQPYASAHPEIDPTQWYNDCMARTLGPDPHLQSKT